MTRNAALCVLALLLSLVCLNIAVPLDRETKFELKQTYEEEIPGYEAKPKVGGYFGGDAAANTAVLHNTASGSTSSQQRGPNTASSVPTGGQPSEDLVVPLTDGSLDEMILRRGSAAGRWLVAFTVPWCAFCQRLAPIWQKLASEFDAKVHVARVVGDENRIAMAKFGVDGFPTIVLIQDGYYYRYPQTEPLSLQGFIQFINGGYRNVESNILPQPVRWTDMVLSELLLAKNDIVATAQQRPDISLLLFMFGILCGVLFTAFAFSCCVDRSLPDAVRKRLLAEPSLATVSRPKRS